MNKVQKSLGSVLLLRLLRVTKVDFYFDQHLIDFYSVICSIMGRRQEEIASLIIFRKFESTFPLCSEKDQP
jgi:hypothetical protein